jgi:hypothetical protein
VNFYYFIESLIVPTPETQMPAIQYRRDEGYTEGPVDNIMIIRSRAAVHPLPAVIGQKEAMTAQPEVAVGPDDILSGQGITR